MLFDPNFYSRQIGDQELPSTASGANLPDFDPNNVDFARFIAEERLNTPKKRARANRRTATHLNVKDPKRLFPELPIRKPSASCSKGSASNKRQEVETRTCKLNYNQQGEKCLEYNGALFPIEELGKGEYHYVYSFTTSEPVTLHTLNPKTNYVRRDEKGRLKVIQNKENETISSIPANQNKERETIRSIPANQLILKKHHPLKTERQNATSRTHGIYQIDLKDLAAYTHYQEIGMPLPECYSNPLTLIDNEVSSNGLFWLIEHVPHTCYDLVDPLTQTGSLDQLSDKQKALLSWVKEWIVKDFHHGIDTGAPLIADFRPANIMLKEDGSPCLIDQELPDDEDWEMSAFHNVLNWTMQNSHIYDFLTETPDYKDVNFRDRLKLRLNNERKKYGITDEKLPPSSRQKALNPQLKPRSPETTSEASVQPMRLPNPSFIPPIPTMPIPTLFD